MSVTSVTGRNSLSHHLGFGASLLPYRHSIFVSLRLFPPKSRGRDFRRCNGCSGPSRTMFPRFGRMSQRFSPFCRQTIGGWAETSYSQGTDCHCRVILLSKPSEPFRIAAREMPQFTPDPILLSERIERIKNDAMFVVKVQFGGSPFGFGENLSKSPPHPNTPLNVPLGRIAASALASSGW